MYTKKEHRLIVGITSLCSSTQICCCISELPTHTVAYLFPSVKFRFMEERI